MNPGHGLRHMEGDGRIDEDPIVFAVRAARPIAAIVGGRMTITDQIHKFVERLAGEPVCDDCITERLDLSVRS